MTTPSGHWWEGVTCPSRAVWPPRSIARPLARRIGRARGTSPASNPEPRGESYMRFLSIVKAAENQGSPPQALLDAIAKLTEDSLKDGSLVQTGGLGQTSTGTRVRLSRGKVTVTDGPFSEAKEVVGGYAVLQAPSRREAIEATRRFLQLHQEHWPGWEGECELRELVFLAP